MAPGNGHRLQAADVDDSVYNWEPIPIDYSIFNARDREISPLNINDLPDKLLICILRHLSPRELLTRVRGVCRRWREVGLQFDLWMHCSLRVPARDDVGTACRALRLAPCFYHMHLDYGDATLAVATLACNTACSIWSLHMNIQRDMPLEPVLWTLLNQAEDVRRLSLALYAVSVGYVSAVIRAIAEMGLCELSLLVVPLAPRRDRSMDVLPLDDLQGVEQENLKRLDLWVPWQVPIAEHLLTFFAPGVETVAIGTRVSRFAFYALQHCPKLTTLCLYPWWRQGQGALLLDSEDVAAMEEYFQSPSAARLQCLRVEERDSRTSLPCQDELLIALLQRLAISGRPQLETLHLCGVAIRAADVDELGPLLARLPKLSRLETDVIPEPLVLTLLSNYFPSSLSAITVAPCNFSLHKMGQVDALLGPDKLDTFCI